MPHNNSRDSPAFQSDPCTLPVTDFPAGAFTALALNSPGRVDHQGHGAAARAADCRRSEHGRRRFTPRARRARQREGRHPQRLGGRADRDQRRLRQGQDHAQDRLCQLAGTKVPLPEATLKKLYPRPGQYAEAVERRLKELIAQGWFLPEYADMVRRDAAGNPSALSTVHVQVAESRVGARRVSAARGHLSRRCSRLASASSSSLCAMYLWPASWFVDITLGSEPLTPLASRSIGRGVLRCHRRPRRRARASRGCSRLPERLTRARALRPDRHRSGFRSTMFVSYRVLQLRAACFTRETAVSGLISTSCSHTAPTSRELLEQRARRIHRHVVCGVVSRSRRPRCRPS